MKKLITLCLMLMCTVSLMSQNQEDVFNYNNHAKRESEVELLNTLNGLLSRIYLKNGDSVDCMIVYTTKKETKISIAMYDKYHVIYSYDKDFTALRTEDIKSITSRI